METWKRFHEKELTHSMAHYIQAVAALGQESGAASVSGIADRLGVSKAGVTSMMRTLKTRGLVRHEPYGDVTLTEEGHRLAAQTARSRDVLTLFLEEILGLPAPVAEEDACMIEHLVSPGAMAQLLRLTAFLRSEEPAAIRFRDAFRDYLVRCEKGKAGSECPICRGICLRQAFFEDMGRAAANAEDP